MLIFFIILAVTVLLLLLVGLILNFFLAKRSKLLVVHKSGKKSPTTQLHELLFQRTRDTNTLDLNDDE